LTPYWEFDFSDLKTDLNTQSKEMMAILLFGGVRLKQTTGRANASMVGTLKAPLVVQTPIGGKGKGGKGAAPKKK
jgi:hypothetical protein